ncbi:MAG: ABC transporter ATP-binding protein [Ruminococcaceae bacterium]|nr:ABC transporter ATP-binding protein [Oscillospiraceae bacterium]
MEAEYAVEINDVYKRYRIYRDKGSELKEKILFRKRNSYTENKVIRGVTVRIRKGEAVGFIGKNGCGKSTLLKLISRIIYPDSGEIVTRGRISGLIELGAGFHPDMTGRENIYTNASIYGLSKREIDEKLEKIIDFSGLADFIDAPVRTYSSGMYMRLGFSVAINVNADILLIDEILAVGDGEFQAKCMNALREIKKNGATIVIVSHALSQIEELCEKSYWIKDGRIQMEGAPSDVHEAYSAETKKE